jgi:TonB family protein
LQRFEGVLEQQVGAGMQIVGFFRSHTRKGLGLRTEDVKIFNRFFPKQYQVALLVKPFVTKPTAGAIFIREGRSLRSESSYKEFPFRTSTVERRAFPAPASNPRSGQPSAVERAAVIPSESRRVIVQPLQAPGSEAPRPEAPKIADDTIAAPAQAATALTVPPEPQPAASPDRQTTPVLTAENTVEQDGALPDGAAPQKRSFGLIWIAALMGSAAALVVLSGLLFFPGLHHTKRPGTTSSRDTSALSLRVERSAGELLLTWNRDADVIHEATRAVLTIADGERYQRVELAQGQLRDGGIVYFPSNSDVNFQLTVTGRKASQTQSESVRVLHVSPWATPEPPQASPPNPVPQRTKAVNTLARISSKTSEGPRAAHAKAPNDAAPHGDDLPQSSGSASALDLPDAPGLTSGPQAPAVLISANTAAPADTQASLFQLLAIAPPDIPEPKLGGRVNEAEILTKTSPEYPLAARQARVQGSVVVRAVIGIDGHVKSAKVLSGPPVLQNPAVAAVRRWVYKPATLNGTAVESEVRVVLNFTLQP